MSGQSRRTASLARNLRGSFLGNCCALLAASALNLGGHAEAAGTFQVTSTTFESGSTLPLTMINNSGSPNTCTANGSAGGNQSPALSWTNAPAGTQDFVVVMFDTTASFTHWIMYNISGTATGLPQNAGVAGSGYGDQTYDDFGTVGYGGPCPPKDVKPDAHKYVFHVYALDAPLNLTGPVNFGIGPEKAYLALVKAARENHVLASAAIFGTYSSTPAK